MRNILYSCLGKAGSVGSSYAENLRMFEVEAENYKTVLKVPDVLHEKEKGILDWLIKCFDLSGTMPTIDLFVAQYPELKDYFAETSSIVEIKTNDLRVYIFNLIDFRVNDYISKRMAQLNEKVKEVGITQEIQTELERLQKLSNRNKAKNVELNISGRENYQSLKLRPEGMKTGIKAIDDNIGGMNEGTMTVIAGFTSQFKTTFSLNIAHLNSYYLGYNVAYISLETPKQDMWWNFLACHSYDTKFSKYPFIGHDRMRRCKLNPEEEDYLFNVVEPDLDSPMELPDGQTAKRGKVIILDESDFDSFSFGEIQAVLDKVDEQLGGNLDALIVDYAQLCKFSGSSSKGETEQVNAYVSFFRRLSQNFKKTVDENGNEKTKQLIVLLLSQIRRDSWRKAVNHGGVYDITCMSDSSELEKSAYRIFTTFTTEEMKQRKMAQVQILKNRSGQTMIAEPAEVYADGEAYVFTDEDGMSQNSFAMNGGDSTASLSAAFDDLGDLSALL